MQLGAGPVIFAVVYPSPLRFLLLLSLIFVAPSPLSPSKKGSGRSSPPQGSLDRRRLCRCARTRLHPLSPTLNDRSGHEDRRPAEGSVCGGGGAAAGRGGVHESFGWELETDGVGLQAGD
ncbi:hypothetical protein Cni_G05986 [Canna indica]|uniref:Uncharacterized protein n=1 Tax=Canna indica TaxID=4628 RepID=A0AAQ3JW49_9LILI|nr:hypothetical protein Cni_G05986 [Canna indica]